MYKWKAFVLTLLVASVLSRRAVAQSESEPNDTPSQANAIACGQTISAGLSPSSDLDYFTFTPGAQTEGLFITSGDAGGDTVIRVFDALGGEIGHNDDTPNGSDFYSTCIVPCLGSGSAVYVRIESFNGLGPIANYQLSIACALTTDVVEIEPNGTNATATNMGNAPVRGCGTAGALAADTDLMRFTLLADSLVTIINGPANADISLRLFTVPGATIWFDNNNGAPGGSQITVGLRAGTYINRARSKYGNSPAQRWSMDIQVAPPVNVELEPNDSVATSSSLNLNQTLSCVIMENLTSGGDLDYYTFTIPPGPAQPIALFTGPSTADTNVTLFGTDGTTVLAFNEDIDVANGNVAAQIDTTLAPGTYFVLAQGHIGAGQVPAVPYALTLFYPVAQDECASGTVNASSGNPSVVLRANGRSDCIDVPLGLPLTLSLAASPSGPAAPRYGMWIWIGGRTHPRDLVVQGTRLGCTVNPTPLNDATPPQPSLCIRGGLPDVVCGNATELPAPPRAPWSIPRNRGFARPIALVVQGVIEDDGAANGLGYSVTNVVAINAVSCPTSFTDMSFSNVNVRVPIRNVEFTQVQLNGSFTVSTQGAVEGSVLATFQDGSSARIDAANGTAVIHTANGVLDLFVSGSNDTYILNGSSILAPTVMQTYHADATSASNPSSWAPESRCMLALSALGQTSGWSCNAILSRAAGSSEPSWWCKVGAGIIAGIAGGLATGAWLTYTGVCTAGEVVTIGGITIPWLISEAICAGLAGGAFVGVYALLVSAW